MDPKISITNNTKELSLGLNSDLPGSAWLTIAFQSICTLPPVNQGSLFDIQILCHQCLHVRRWG